jgi:membrane dipeptidase
MVRTREDLSAVLEGWNGDAPGDVGIVVLMEGADPIRTPDDVPVWHDEGVRIVGLAWKRTRYSGGTGTPGPLTAEGRGLVDALSEHGVMLDLSHAAEEAYFEALDRFSGIVIASHANPRALCPGDRQLSDEMIRRLVHRDGVVGIVPFNRMLDPGWSGPGAPRIPLQRVAEAILHVAEVAGTHRAVAIGSDFDGGFGALSAPAGLDTVADLTRIADALSDAGLADAMIEDVLGGNWIRILKRALPQAGA